MMNKSLCGYTDLKVVFHGGFNVWNVPPTKLAFNKHLWKNKKQTMTNLTFTNSFKHRNVLKHCYQCPDDTVWNIKQQHERKWPLKPQTSWREASNAPSARVFKPGTETTVCKRINIKLDPERNRTAEASARRSQTSWAVPHCAALNKPLYHDKE